MAIVYTGRLNIPNVTCLSSDVSGGVLPGVQPGLVAYYTDTKAWVIVKDDLTLAPYVLPFSASVDIGDVTLLAGTALVGKVGIDQATANANEVVVKSITTSETHLGEVGGSTAVISVTPAITAGAYSANDCIGAKQEITLAARASGVPVTLQSLVITDLGMQNAALIIFIFSGNPATGTYTDNLECDIDDTDLGQCVGVLNTGDGAWVSAKDNSVFMMTNIGLLIDPATTSVYAVVKTTGTPTYTSVADLVFKYGFYRD